MALVLEDRVRETTATAGTGTITLGGAVTGYQSFSVIGNGNTTYYCIAGQGNSEWEVGIGTYSTTGPTLARTTVLSSSNSGSLVNFSAGTKDVFVTYPSEKSVNLDASGLLSATAGLGTGIPTFLATPSSANLAAAVTGETGSGALVFATSPSLTTPNLGTPSAINLSNATALPLATAVSGTLAVNNGGTGLTSLTAHYIPYGNGTSAYSSSAALTYDGTIFKVGSTAAISGTTNPIAAFTGAANGYVQTYIFNATAGGSSSADLVAYPDNGADTSGWVDIGITSSTYSDAAYTVTGPNESYVFASAPSGASKTGNLVYATDSTGTENSHQWYVGGFNQAKSAWKMQLTSTALSTTNDVGINATGGGSLVPIAPLHVAMPEVGGEAVRLSWNTGSTTQGEASIGFGLSQSAVYPNAQISGQETDTSDYRGNLLFYTRDTNSDIAPTERMRITSAGLVNIPGLTASKVVFTDASDNLASTGTVGVDQGGTGQTTYTNGQLLIGNTTGNTLTKATLTAGSGITVTNGAGSITIASTAGAPDTQTFNSSGTWTKPGSGNFVRIQMWGGGGGGSRVTTANGSNAGGGGGYFELTVPIASMGATAAVTVGAAGAGRTGSAGSGTNGGNSGVTLGSGTTIYVSGGEGGVGAAAGSGGYGALVFSTTVISDPTNIGKGAGNCYPMDGYSYTGGGAGSPAIAAGGKGGWGGGGGTYGTGAGGTSVFAGAGGNASTNGTAPGGGGGSSTAANTNATNGATGIVIITTF